MLSPMPAPSPARATPLHCIGHSHVTCVAQAARIAETSLQAWNFWEMPGAVERADGEPRLSPTMSQQVQQIDGPVFSLIGGAAHGVLGMLVHPRRFDFVLAEEPGLALDAAAELIPCVAVQRTLEALMSDYLILMAQVNSLCQGPMFHIESPPPFADAQRMQQDIPWDMYPGMLHEISSAPLRYKLWRLHSSILREWCAAAGAGFVPAPPATMDQNGFMLEAFYGDGAHANAAYGELVLAQMRRLA